MSLSEQQIAFAEFKEQKLANSNLDMRTQDELDRDEARLLRALNVVSHKKFTGESFPKGWIHGDGKGNFKPELDGAHHLPEYAQPQGV